jgi:dTDP-4-dehydrorhamnose reductase
MTETPSKLRVLVTGASGFLGRHLLKSLADFDVTALYSSSTTFIADFPHIRSCTLDLSDAAATRALVTQCSPDAVIHLAAVSSPAACERAPDETTAINAPSALIETLSPTAFVIFLSTDQVYDGTVGKYTEDSDAAPVNAYGRSKLAFEGALARALPSRSVSLRSSLILGGRAPGCAAKQSFLQFCDERLATGEVTEFFLDEVRGWCEIPRVRHVSTVCFRPRAPCER